MEKFKRIIMFPIFHLILEPLIRRNYTRRYTSALSNDGAYEDKWFWADSISARYGYFVYDYPHRIQHMESMKALAYLKNRKLD